MPINPTVREIIADYVISSVKRNKSTVRQLTRNFGGPQGITESEVRLTINELIRDGFLLISRKGRIADFNELSLGAPYYKPDNNTKFQLVMSRPRLRELGLYSIQQRNNYLETKECFTEIIKAATETIRICSPFFQRNVLEEDVFPELRPLLIQALERGIHVKILSRELFSKRKHELSWLDSIKKDIPSTSNLTIVDYHVARMNSVFSSTHAKLIIADCSSAYIGSAELRKNSLISNFEIGCYVIGPEVVGICEVFDLMFSKGKIWGNPNEICVD
jgi:hypothetical protein